jgi:hypothetical protein
MIRTSRTAERFSLRSSSGQARICSHSLSILPAGCFYPSRSAGGHYRKRVHEIVDSPVSFSVLACIEKAYCFSCRHSVTSEHWNYHGYEMLLRNEPHDYRQNQFYSKLRMAIRVERTRPENESYSTRPFTFRARRIFSSISSQKVRTPRRIP